MYKEKIIDLKTGKETYRDYTDEEIAIVEEAQLLQAKMANEAKKNAEAKIALLEKLGITEEEARLLLS